MKSLLRQHFGIVVIFISTFLIGLAGTASVCSRHISFGFDGQNLITWDYEAFSRFVPYKDVAYYYGLLAYYKNDMPIVFLVYALIAPSLFVAFFLIFRRLFPNTFLSYLTLSAFVLFVMLFTGIENFARYGIGVCFSLLVALQMLRSIKTAKSFIWLSVVSGVVTGVTFSLVTDQGAFLAASFMLLVPIFIFTQKKPFLARILTLVQIYAIFLLSVMIGLIPFVVFLVHTHALAPFIGFVYQLSLLTTFAKVPFLPFASSASNVFTFSALFLAVFTLSYRIFFDRDELKSQPSTIEIALCVVLILLEQKSFVRSIDAVITFAAFLLWLTLCADLLQHIKSGKAGLLLAICALPFLSRLPFQPNLSLSNSEQQFSDSIAALVRPKAIQACRAKSFQQFDLLPRSYAKVVLEFVRLGASDHAFFSFPGDPIFYVLLHQQPPRYFTTYESSAESAQLDQIKYMEQRQIQYVIYNTQHTNMDGVPHILRDETLSQYIFTHFTPVESIDEFVILKRSPNPDLFTAQKLPSALRSQLLDVALEYIPKSEGQKTLPKSNLLARGTENDVNQFLASHNISSEHVFLSITADHPQKYSTARITTRNGIATVATFQSCQAPQQCLIHLGNLPLFYSNRTISRINVDTPSIITLYNLGDARAFW
jgi:hypothetical protein